MEGEATQVGHDEGDESDDAPNSPRPFCAQACSLLHPKQACGCKEDEQGGIDPDHPQRRQVSHAPVSPADKSCTGHALVMHWSRARWGPHSAERIVPLLLTALEEQPHSTKPLGRGNPRRVGRRRVWRGWRASRRSQSPSSRAVRTVTDGCRRHYSGCRLSETTIYNSTTRQGITPYRRH